MNNQNALWDNKYGTRDYTGAVLDVQDFAKTVGSVIQPGTRLLELGCGVGSDATYFASLGAEVTATDFSAVVIEEDKVKHQLPNLTFEVADVAQPLPFDSEIFDAVYAHLSLHYYNEEMTAGTFKEIARVLKVGGMLYFACKSVHDPLCGGGTEVQPGVFEREGHIRHFFSREYTEKLLSEDYEVEKLEEIEGEYDTFSSAFIQCWAKRKEL